MVLWLAVDAGIKMRAHTGLTMIWGQKKSSSCVWTSVMNTHDRAASAFLVNSWEQAGFIRYV